MDLSFTPEEQAFREEVREFLAENLSGELRSRVAARVHMAKEDIVAWQRILHKKGWGAPNWPAEFGGTGWTPAQRYIFDEECNLADAPPQSPFGLAMVGPVIYAFGNDEQKAKYLPRILSGDDWWCQGYSESGAGSDLASLKTRAVRDGDRYIVNGHKIWTTQAHYANMMFCLVRTDPHAKPQEGISFILIEMDQPGITVKPIITIDEGHSINEVFLDDVVAPVENLIGEENKGWTYAKFLLGHERTGIAQVNRSKKQLHELKRIAGAELQHGEPLLKDPGYARKVAELEVDLAALEFTNLRVLADANAGRDPGPASSILKIKGSEMTQRILEATVEALGYYAAPYEMLDEEGSNLPPIGPDYAHGVMSEHLYMRAATIYGGSNEIQKNIIAKMVLGL